LAQWPLCQTHLPETQAQRPGTQICSAEGGAGLTIILGAGGGTGTYTVVLACEGGTATPASARINTHCISTDLFDFMSLYYLCFVNNYLKRNTFIPVDWKGVRKDKKIFLPGNKYE